MNRRIVTTGDALREQLIRDNGIDPRRIDSVPTGIDTAQFAPRSRTAARSELDLPRHAPLIGIVATLAEIFIVDSSRDRTAEIAEELGCRVFKQFPPRGYGPAMERAVRDAGGDVVITLDCDDTYPVEAIPTLVSLIEGGFDLVNMNWIHSLSFDLHGPDVEILRDEDDDMPAQHFFASEHLNELEEPSAVDSLGPAAIEMVRPSLARSRVQSLP